MEFNLASGWKDSFRKRTILILRTVCGKLHSANPTVVELWKTAFASPG
jgi:hypothetical protein